MGVGKRPGPEGVVDLHSFRGLKSPAPSDTTINLKAPQGLKPTIFIWLFAARLKPCPDTKQTSEAGPSTSLRMTSKNKCKNTSRSFDFAQDDKQKQVQKHEQILRLAALAQDDEHKQLQKQMQVLRLRSG